VLVHTFVEVFEPNAKVLLNSALCGKALEKTYDELFALLNKTLEGNPKWNGDIARIVVQKTVRMLKVAV